MGLLDAYPAAVAWSLRKIRDGYAGPCVRVRRSVDNDERSIGFVGSQLHVWALLSFVGSGHGYVSRWYDQGTTDRYAEQASSGYQPILVESGHLVTSASGHPAIRFGDNNNIHLVVSGNAPIAAGGIDRSYHAAFQQDAAELRPAVFCEGQNNALRTFACLSEYAIRLNGGNVIFDAAAALGSVEVATWGASGGTVGDAFARRNGTQLGVSSTTSSAGAINTTGPSYIGYYTAGVGTGSFLGRLNEVIAMPTLLTAEQITAIESSMDYWRQVPPMFPSRNSRLAAVHVHFARTRGTR